MQGIQQLSLVLVDSLDVAVKQRLWVDLDPTALLEVVGKLAFVVLRRQRKHALSHSSKGRV